MIEVPPAVAAKAREFGVAGWLDDLTDLVAGLAAEWSLDVGPAFRDATEAFVAPVTTADGTPAVLKILLPRASEDVDHEILALRLADGRGCVRLYRADEDLGALLLERLGPSLSELEVPIRRRLEILCDVASRVWRRVDGAALPTGADKARWLGEFITATWERTNRPCDERAVAHALDCAARREAAHDPARARLVHGDVHQWNALRSGDGFALVDPDGLCADPEYDLGVIMREDPVELLRDGPRARSRRLAARTGLDETRIWEWGVVERVSTGLLLTALQLEPAARQMLRAAEAIAAG